jgi:thymidine phosphorylase
MVRIGKDAGVRTEAILSSMEQPLGRTVGNALEVAEAVDILKGKGPADVTEICRHETAALLTLAGLSATEEEGAARAQKAIDDGSGLEKLAEVVAAQGGDARQIEDTGRLPTAPVREVVAASRTGFIAAIQAERIGIASVSLGAGRRHKGDPIDHAVGLVLLAKVGDYVKAGAPLIEVHARSIEQARGVVPELLAAYRWDEEVPSPASHPQLILDTVH